MINRMSKKYQSSQNFHREPQTCLPAGRGGREVHRGIQDVNIYLSFTSPIETNTFPLKLQVPGTILSKKSIAKND